MIQNPLSEALSEKIATYTELLGKDPRSTIFVPLCETYRQMGKLEEAVNVANKGIMENPSFPAGYIALGRIRYQQDAMHQAIDEFEKALILDKNNLAALKGLAKIRLRQNDRKEARKLLDRVIRLDPENETLTRLLALLEKQRTAVGARRSDVSRDVPSVDAAETEEEEQAPEPIATVTIAEIYIRQGFLEKALKVYRDLSRVNPRNDLLRQKLVSLKRQIEEKRQPEDEALNNQGNSTETAEAEKTILHEMPEIVCPEPAAAMESLMESPLVSVLTRWLDSITRRRDAHVR